MPRVRQLVAMLDSQTSAGGNIHVVYLKNAVAVKLAEVLRAIYIGRRRARDGACGGESHRAGLGGGRTAPTQSASLAPGIIQADAATNSIIITAPDAIYNNLRAAVEKLDVRRAQVYVEALIAEITADKAAEFGVQWQGLSGLGKSDTQGIRWYQFRQTRRTEYHRHLPRTRASSGRGLNIGVVNGTVTIPGVGEILNLGRSGPRTRDATPTRTSCRRRRC